MLPLDSSASSCTWLNIKTVQGEHLPVLSPCCLFRAWPGWSMWGQWGSLGFLHMWGVRGGNVSYFYFEYPRNILSGGNSQTLEARAELCYKLSTFHAVCRLYFQLKCKMKIPRSHCLRRITGPERKAKENRSCCFVTEDLKNQTSSFSRWEKHLCPLNKNGHSG